MAKPTDTDRFYAELWPHRAAVLRVALILTHSDADAEDLAQDVMLKAFAAIATLSPGTNAKAWLLAVLRNAHIDRTRAKGRREVSLESLEIEPADQHDAGAEDASAWGDPRRALAEFGDQEIIAALKKLPEEIRWTLLLVDVQGLDDREAAEVLGVPAGTVKSRLHRGRRMLREALLPLARDRRIGVEAGDLAGEKDRGD